MDRDQGDPYGSEVGNREDGVQPKNFLVRELQVKGALALLTGLKAQSQAGGVQWNCLAFQAWSLAVCGK